MNWSHIIISFFHFISCIAFILTKYKDPYNEHLTSLFVLKPRWVLSSSRQVFYLPDPKQIDNVNKSVKLTNYQHLPRNIEKSIESLILSNKNKRILCFGNKGQFKLGDVFKLSINIIRLVGGLWDCVLVLTIWEYFHSFTKLLGLGLNIEIISYLAQWIVKDMRMKILAKNQTILIFS